MATALNEEKIQLEETLEKLDDQRSEIQNRLQKITKELEVIELHQLSSQYIQFLDRRLHRLKDYLGNSSQCQTFQKIEMQTEPRTDDWHKSLMDQVPWTIQDYEVLDLSQHIDITFRIYSPAVAQQVQDWIQKEIPSLRMGHSHSFLPNH